MPLNLIHTARHIVLVVHKTPDADSLGSACAFYSHLLRLQKQVTLFCVSPEVNPSLGFLPWFDKLTSRFPENADCMISFDCGSYGRLGIENALPLINVDHHISNDCFGSLNLVDTGAMSTTEVLYDFFVANDIKINGKMALSLYAGLMDDSKCFSSPTCSAKTFAVAQRLIELGADHSMCVEWLYHRRSLASLRLKGALLKKMSVVAQGRLAIFDVPLSLLEETGAVEAECKRVLDAALEMRTVQAALMKIERPDGGVKLSLRSDGGVDAAKIMAAFGGGGHVSRAGTQLKDEKYNEFVENMIAMITKELM